MPQLPSNSPATITEENEEETARGENHVFVSYMCLQLFYGGQSVLKVYVLVSNIGKMTLNYEF
jgi:hypothetical protein